MSIHIVLTFSMQKSTNANKMHSKYSAFTVGKIYLLFKNSKDTFIQFNFIYKAPNYNKCHLKALR